MRIKKSLLALALASSSILAIADVKLYGKIAAGMGYDQFQDINIPPSISAQDFGSYFGIRGSDKIMGETLAIFQVEQFLDLTSGQAYNSTTGAGLISPSPSNPSVYNGYLTRQVNTLASSESYIGLQGAFGRVRIGNLSNFARSNMSAVDSFNYANGANGLGIYSRTNKILPTSVRYDTPSLGGFVLSLGYGFNSNGLTNASGITGVSNGTYSGGIYDLGLGWKMNNFSINLGTTLWQNVGSYQTATSGNTPGVDKTQPNLDMNTAAYSGAYASRFEIGYDNPEGFMAGLGYQIANGLGWSGWANSGGATNGIVNPGYQSAGLACNQYQTMEASLMLGYHMGAFTPKIGYAYGGNIMYGNNLGDIMLYQGNKIADSGYQQGVVELDYSLSPRTIAFVNYGQAWVGKTLSNVSYLNVETDKVPVDGNNAYMASQSSVAVGFSHTF